jgi:thiamine-monophosphate kinase
MREFDFINRIKKSAGSCHSVIRSIGDDCAIIPYNSDYDMLFTCDSLYEGVHFSKKYFLPWEIGARAMAVNLSDICAMGGVPLYALVSIGFPGREKQAYIDEIYRGITDYASDYGTDIIGGDTISADKIFLSITVIGRVERTKALRRDRAKSGDAVFTTGFLGDSFAGLKILSKKGRRRLKSYECTAVIKHKLPVPSYLEGRQLLESGCVNACMDISDGLVNDLTRICEESGKGAEIFADTLPVSYSCFEIAGQHGEDPVDYALYGGEDFELLFTVPQAKVNKFSRYAAGSGLIAFEVGRITSSKGIYIKKDGKKNREKYNKTWKHF